MAWGTGARNIPRLRPQQGVQPLGVSDRASRPRAKAGPCGIRQRNHHQGVMPPAGYGRAGRPQGRAQSWSARPHAARPGTG